MAHIPINVMKLCSRLNEFRLADKYTDVIIRCENKSFKCHRIILALASNVFDTWFNNTSNFVEKTEESLNLRSITACTFEGVLHFMYTGDFTISHENICSMLEASEFLDLPGIRELCERFISQNKMNVQNTVTSFAFACKIRQQNLIDRLSTDIAEQLRIFLRASSFLELPFDEFTIIIKKYKSFARAKDKMLMAAITQWILHHRKDRGQYFNSFTMMIADLNKVKCEIMNFISQLEQPMFTPMNSVSSSYEPDVCGLTHDEAIAVRDVDVSEGLRDTTGNNTMTSDSLYAYIKCEGEKLMKVFSINENHKCALACEIPINHRDQSMKIVTLDRHQLFSFHYIRRNPAIARTCSQSFYAHSSVDMSSNINLKSPPIIFDDVSMCALQNNIYVYNQTLSQAVPTVNSSNISFFNDEEVGRGMYVYNCEVDRWFPVPAMKHKLGDACMTIHNNILYLVGGSLPKGGAASKTVQTYDYRAKDWCEMKNTTESLVGADCCVMNSLIYICGGKYSKKVEIYNPVNQEFRKLHSILPRVMVHHKLNSYAGKLWVMGGYGKDDKDIPSKDLSYHSLDDFSSSSWTSHSSIVTEATEKKIDVSNGSVLDFVVFESL